MSFPPERIRFRSAMAVAVATGLAGMALGSLAERYEDGKQTAKPTVAGQQLTAEETRILDGLNGPRHTVAGVFVLKNASFTSGPEVRPIIQLEDGEDVVVRGTTLGSLTMQETVLAGDRWLPHPPDRASVDNTLLTMQYGTLTAQLVGADQGGVVLYFNPYPSGDVDNSPPVPPDTNGVTVNN